MKRPTNSAVAKGISTSDPNATSWATFDTLPGAIRRLLWGAPISINPVSAETLKTIGGDDYAHRALSDAIGQEVAAFDAQHLTAHGYKLPAVAAEVAPLVYGAATTTVKSRPGRRVIFRAKRRRTA